MRELGVICAVVGLLAVAGTANANTIASSTMYFQGSLTYNAGAYTGTIPAIAGYYYVTGGPGESIWDQGGFDVYAKAGGTTYVQGMTPNTWTIGCDHDAYSKSGPWGTWYDPDVADYYQYELQLTADHWYLRYAPTGESPMSGGMNWTTLIATESDLGTQAGGHDGSAVHGGGAGAWDWDCGWGVEVIPLESDTFDVTVISLAGGGYEVSLAPVPEPLTMLGMFLGLGSVGAYIRRRRLR